jgi:hypothetical protein
VTALVSFHQLRDWLCCPQLYAYKHIHHIPDYSFAVERQKGELLHHWIELDGKGKKVEIPQEYESIWKNYQKAMAPWRLLKTQFEWAYLFSIELENQNWGLTGRIDLLVYLTDKLVIIDWKTGKGPASITDIWQMDWYAWSIDKMRESLGISSEIKIETRWFYLADGTSQEQLYERPRLDSLEQEFRNHIAQLNSKEYAFIPNPHSWQQENWCQRCTYQEICPEGIRYRHERADFTV